MHFTYDVTIYQQDNGVTIGSPLRPFLSRIFMFELENSLILTLKESMTLWWCFVDETIMLVKSDGIAYALGQSNNFHKRIKFTYEVEHNSKLLFLNVLLVKNGNNIDTTV